MRRPEHAVGDSTIETRSHATIEIADQMHDRSRDLLQDPPIDPEDDEVWFDAEALAAASMVDLSAAESAGDLLERSPALEQIAAAIATPGISLASLPGWPRAGAAGQGLGAIADELIGELRPGELVLLGGSQRGVGRTSLLAQLGDGLALASEPERPTTPVLLAVEGAPALWRARSLARYFDVDPRTFVEAERARREPRCVAMLDEFRCSPWARLEERQRFVAREALSNPERRSETIAALRRWQAQLGEGAWPIVIIDPLEHLCGPTDMIETVHQLAALATAERLIVIASCDLDDDRDPAQTRAFDTFATLRLRATTVDEHTLALELCHRRLGPRGRGQLRWHRTSGRFEALE